MICSSPLGEEESVCFSHQVMYDSFGIPWTVAHQAPPFPSPGDLPKLGIELMSPALTRGFLTTEPPGKLT